MLSLINSLTLPRLCSFFVRVLQREPNSSVLNFEGGGILPLLRNLISWRNALSEDAPKKTAKSSLRQKRAMKKLNEGVSKLSPEGKRYPEVHEKLIDR